MDVHQIRSFLAVADLLHFSRAAERVHLSQPALSLQIRALEDELGVRLFDRTRRRTELTAAGIAFRNDAAEALAHIERGAARARQAAAGKLGSLRIGFISTAAAQIVPPLVAEFRRTHPDVELEMRHALTAEQIDMLETGDLDVGFFRMPFAAGRGLVTAVVHREPFRLFLPAAHPLAAKPAPAIRDLDGCDVVIYARRNAPGYHDFLLRLVADAGAAPAALHEANDMNTLTSLIAAGVGVAIAPASIGANAPANVVIRDLPEAPPSEIAMAYRADESSAAARAFIDLAIDRAAAFPD